MVEVDEGSQGVCGRWWSREGLRSGDCRRGGGRGCHNKGARQGVVEGLRAGQTALCFPNIPPHTPLPSHTLTPVLTHSRPSGTLS